MAVRQRGAKFGGFCFVNNVEAICCAMSRDAFEVGNI